MAGDFEVDEHTAPYECGTMLQPFLADARCNSKRCEAKALGVDEHTTSCGGGMTRTAVKKGLPVRLEK
jgi:hypothetical protein